MNTIIAIYSLIYLLLYCYIDLYSNLFIIIILFIDAIIFINKLLFLAAIIFITTLLFIAGATQHRQKKVRAGSDTRVYDVAASGDGMAADIDNFEFRVTTEFPVDGDSNVRRYLDADWLVDIAIH